MLQNRWGNSYIYIYILLSLPSFLPSCVWSCLVSKHASGHVSPCVASCVTGDPSPQVEVLLLAGPHGPADPDKSAVNASRQLNVLIGSDMHSRPYASFMPPRPQKPGVGRYVCVCVCVLLNYIIQHLLWGVYVSFSFPLFPWLNSTQYSGQLKVCVFMLVCVYVAMCMCHTKL